MNWMAFFLFLAGMGAVVLYVIFITWLIITTETWVRNYTKLPSAIAPITVFFLFLILPAATLLGLLV